MVWSAVAQASGVGVFDGAASFRTSKTVPRLPMSVRDVD